MGSINDHIARKTTTSDDRQRSSNATTEADRKLAPARTKPAKKKSGIKTTAGK